MYGKKNKASSYVINWKVELFFNFVFVSIKRILFLMIKLTFEIRITKRKGTKSTGVHVNYTAKIFW